MEHFILSGFGDEISPVLSEQLEAMQKLGIHCLEARNVNGVNISDLTMEQAKAAKDTLSEFGFTLSALGSPIGKISIRDPFEPHLDKFKHTLELAKFFGCPNIRMFSFFIGKDVDPDNCKDAVLERWNKFIEAAKGWDITLLHENEKEIYGDIARRCKTLVTELNCPYVKLVFDPANFIQCGQEVFPDAYELLKDDIAYMHIKDALYSTGEPMPCGQGDGRVKDVLQALIVSGYQGYLSIEPHLGAFEGLDKLENDKNVAGMQKSSAKLFAAAYSGLAQTLEQCGIKI